MIYKRLLYIASAILALLTHPSIYATPITYEFAGQVISGAPTDLTVSGWLTLDPAFLTASFGDGATHNVLTPPFESYSTSPLGINVHLLRSDGAVMAFTDTALNFAYIQLMRNYWGFQNEIVVRAETIDDSGNYRDLSIHAIDNMGSASGMFAPGTAGNLDPLQYVNWDADGIFMRTGNFVGLDANGVMQNFEFTLDTIRNHTVPEPSTLPLTALALAGMAVYRRKRVL